MIMNTFVYKNSPKQYQSLWMSFAILRISKELEFAILRTNQTSIQRNRTDYSRTSRAQSPLNLF